MHILARFLTLSSVSEVAEKNKTGGVFDTSSLQGGMNKQVPMEGTHQRKSVKDVGTFGFNEISCPN